MNETNLMDYIPPEQLSLIISAIVTAIASIVGALGVGLAIYVRSMFKTWAKEHESKRKNDELEREARNREIDAKIEFQRMEIQARLDTTETNRETQRLWMSQLDEERRDNAEQRKAFERREAIHIEAMQGIQSNTAATFGLMKEMVEKLSKHQESDETMEIKQGKIIAQNDKTHSQNEVTHGKLEAIGNTLAEIATELKSVTVGRASDRETLNDILSKVARLQENVATIEALSKAPPETVAATTQSDTTPVTPEIPEVAKEKPE